MFVRLPEQLFELQLALKYNMSVGPREYPHSNHARQRRHLTADLMVSSCDSAVASFGRLLVGEFTSISRESREEYSGSSTPESADSADGDLNDEFENLLLTRRGIFLELSFPVPFSHPAFSPCGVKQQVKQR